MSVSQTHPAKLHRSRSSILAFVADALDVRLHRLLTTPVTRRAFLRIVHATSHGIHRSSGDSRRRRRRRRIFSRSLLLTLFSIFFSRRCAVFGVIYLLHDSRRASSLTFRYQNSFPFLLREKRILSMRGRFSRRFSSAKARVWTIWNTKRRRRQR